jgi:hypothetical protein
MQALVVSVMIISKGAHRTGKQGRMKRRTGMTRLGNCDSKESIRDGVVKVKTDHWRIEAFNQAQAGHIGASQQPLATASVSLLPRGWIARVLGDLGSPFSGDLPKPNTGSPGRAKR